MHLNYSYEQNYDCFVGSFYFYYVSIQCEAMPTCPRPMFHLWTIRPLDDTSLGRYVPWTIRPLDDTSLGRCVRWTMEDASLERCNPHCTVPKIPIYVCNPRNETALPRSQFLHLCICERIIYSRDRSAYLAAVKISTEKLGNRLVRGEGVTPMAPPLSTAYLTNN
jgi:hypothetical protein